MGVLAFAAGAAAGAAAGWGERGSFLLGLYARCDSPEGVGEVCKLGLSPLWLG